MTAATATAEEMLAELRATSKRLDKRLAAAKRPDAPAERARRDRQRRYAARACSECSRPIPVDAHGHTRTCSPACYRLRRNRNYRVTRRAARAAARAARPARQCIVCGKPVPTPSRPDRERCDSEDCRLEIDRRRHRARRDRGDYRRTNRGRARKKESSP